MVLFFIRIYLSFYISASCTILDWVRSVLKRRIARLLCRIGHFLVCHWPDDASQT